MTYFAFLTLSLATLVLGAPKPRGKRQAASIKPTCSRTTICIHAQNDCDEWYGGCYDMCTPTTFYPPPCLVSSAVATTTTSSSSSYATKTISLGATATTTNPAVTGTLGLAENGAEDTETEDDPLEDAPLIVGDLPTRTDTPAKSIALTSITTDETPPWVTEAAETTVTSTSNEGSPPWVTVNDDDDDPIPTITVAPTSDDTSSTQCGLTTSCYDWLNEKCTPAYRWGTCVDVCSTFLVPEPPCPTPGPAPVQQT